MKRILPNFLFIGPDKAGSTWLYEVLRAHPDCWVPDVKDIYFFDRYYHRGLHWYARFFRHAPAGARAVGELSHDYLMHAEAAERIATDLPGVRLLTCLREPVERSFSHYQYLVRSGLTRLSFAQALDQFPGIIDNSMYARHLGHYLERFSREQITVLWFDELKRDPEAFARKVFRALEVPFHPGFDYAARVLPASRPRNPLIARVFKHGANLARELGLVLLVGRLKRSRYTQWFYIPFEPGRKPRPSHEAAARVRSAVRSDVERLEQLLEIDLTGWKIGPEETGLIDWRKEL